MNRRIIVALATIGILIALALGRVEAIEYCCEKAQKCEQKGDYKQAIETINMAVLLSPRASTVLVYRGKLYFYRGNAGKALEDLVNAIKLDRKNPEAHFVMALIKQEQGDLEQAIDELNLVIRERPGWVKAYLNRQVAYRRLGQKHKAKEDIMKVLEIDPGNETAKRALRTFD